MTEYILQLHVNAILEVAINASSFKDALVAAEMTRWEDILTSNAGLADGHFDLVGIIKEWPDVEADKEG